MNNKGFAITGILYGVLIVFLLVLASFLSVLNSKKNLLENSTIGIKNEIESSSTALGTVITGTTNYYIAPYNGKYTISTSNCTGDIYLPRGYYITINASNNIVINYDNEIPCSKNASKELSYINAISRTNALSTNSFRIDSVWASKKNND